MNLPKIHSVTKKILVALVGGFLLIFLLFHMTANLFILRHDDGAWYSAFCHFMGTNWIVKIAEIGLLGFIALHILLTLWLAFTNRLARPVRYHQASRSKTHTTSKLMIWTGILIFVCLFLHFCDFYFVKLGFVKGEYMVKVESIAKSPSAMNDEEVMMLAYSAVEDNRLSEDGEWIRHLSYDERNLLKEHAPDTDPEPDFYYMTREKFSHLHIVIGYLFFFFVIFMHLRHAFPSAFQTLGLNNYKYNNIIEWLGKAYTWVICLGFAVVPILVYLGL
ncbi:MAG: succinate dehydrogenase cytochrome b subunit [Bacteroidales bacterium]|nr:succinate dehydrogenase cytochrome b subunit [Bacteroidales bacterium]